MTLLLHVHDNTVLIISIQQNILLVALELFGQMDAQHRSIVKIKDQMQMKNSNGGMIVVNGMKQGTNALKKDVSHPIKI